MLSIIIPVYNGEKYLKETINNILFSDFRDVEVVAVNDGSTDSSIEILEDIAKKDCRLKIYTKENSGIAESRNYGINKATGEFITFVDQDDVIKCDIFKLLIEKMKDTKADMAVCSSARLVDGEEIPLEIQTDGLYCEKEILETLIMPIFLRAYDNPYTDIQNRYFHIWNCLFRTSFLRKHDIKFRAYVNYEDDLLMKIDALSHANTVCTIHEIGYQWRINTKSESFAHHFVDNIGAKQTQCYEDIKDSLLHTQIDEEQLRWVTASIYCTHFLDAIQNLVSKEYKKNLRIIQKYCEENIYNRKIDDVAWINSYAKKGWVRLNVIIPKLIERKGMRAFYCEKIIENLLMVQIKFKKLMLFEKMIKGKK